MDGPIDGSDDVIQKNKEEVTKDPTYFLQWEFITLKVEDRLFRVPQDHLLKESYVWREKFKSRSAEGSSDESLFIVGGGITATELRHFLQMILPSVTEDPEMVWGDKMKSPSKDQWISVLKVSTIWRCLNLRKLAIRKLESKLEPKTISGLLSTHRDDLLTPTEKIFLGRKYYISRWIEAGYVAVVKQGNVTYVEMKVIGAVESCDLFRIILDFMKQPQLGTSALERRVKADFQAEMEVISAIENLYMSQS